MKKILLIIAMLFCVASYGQTIGYLRYDSVKIAKPGGNAELIIENATKAVTGGVLTNTGNGRSAWVAGGGVVVSDSAWSLTGNSGTTAGTNFIGTTDSVAFVGKTNNTERWRVAGNGSFGINNNAPAFRFDVVGDAQILDGTNRLFIQGDKWSLGDEFDDAFAFVTGDLSTKEAQLSANASGNTSFYLNGTSGLASVIGSHIQLRDSSISSSAANGYIFTLLDNTNGQGTWKAASGSATSWNAITNPTADQALTFDAGESSTWTDANTTEDLFTVNSSTGTTNSMFSLNRTGTALAAGNNILELVSSGANGTNAITATGARISVTNTNATSGTNVGLAVTATGATTANYAIQATGAMTLTAAAQTPASFESSFAGNMLVPFNSTTSNNVNFAFQKAGVVQWYVGNNASVNRFHILNASAAEAVTVLQGLQVGINQTAPTARLHLGAGATTASYAPLKFTSGTSNTVAEAGAMEYTTPRLFFTNGRAVRQEIFQGQQSRVSTQYDNATTTLGNVTGLTANVAASGTYRFEAKLYTTSDVAGGIKVAIGGTATATAIRYEGLTTDAGLTTQGRATALGTAVGAVTAVTAAYVVITGTITVNAAGTITVQAAANAATGTTSVLTGSTFFITEML